MNAETIRMAVLYSFLLTLEVMTLSPEYPRRADDTLEKNENKRKVITEMLLLGGDEMEK